MAAATANEHSAKAACVVPLGPPPKTLQFWKPTYGVAATADGHSAKAAAVVAAGSRAHKFTILKTDARGRCHRSRPQRRKAAGVAADVTAGTCVPGRMALALACAGVQHAGKPDAHGDGLLWEHDLRRKALASARARCAGSPWAEGTGMLRGITRGAWRWRVLGRMAHGAGVCSSAWHAGS